MQERGISRFVPLLVICGLLLALGIYYTPGVVRAWKFRSTANALLADVRSGNTAAIPGYTLPEQQALLSTFLGRADVSGYVSEIRSLKLSHYQREEDHIWSTVTAKGRDGSLGQGNLRWIWNGARWELDALNSYVTYGITVGQDRGLRIGDLVTRTDLSGSYE